MYGSSPSSPTRGAVDDIDRLIEGARPTGVSLSSSSAPRQAHGHPRRRRRRPGHPPTTGAPPHRQPTSSRPSRRDRRDAPRGGRTPTAQRAAGGARPHIASAGASRSSGSIPPVPDGGDDLADDDEPVGDQPHPEVIVRILGVPSVDGHPSLGRIDLNLITFLACSGGIAESQVIDAVWNGQRIERSTLWNRISKARTAPAASSPTRTRHQLSTSPQA